MKISLDKADTVFSQYVRLRDKHCQRCLSPVELNGKGLPISHQASHYFGRGRENTRFDPLNVDTLCHGCHRIWGSDDREGYRTFKVEQLGVKEYAHLCIRANLYCKRDRKMRYIEVKLLLKELRGKI